MRRLPTRFTAIFLATALIAVSPGLFAYEAFARTIARVPVVKAVVPTAQVGSAASAISGPRLSPSLTPLSTLPMLSRQGLKTALPSLNTVIPSLSQNTAVSAAGPVPTVAFPKAERAAEAEAPTAFGRLSTTAAQTRALPKLGGASLKHASGRFFEGDKKIAGADAVFAEAPAPASSGLGRPTETKDGRGSLASNIPLLAPAAAYTPPATLLISALLGLGLTVAYLGWRYLRSTDGNKLSAGYRARRSLAGTFAALSALLPILPTPEAPRLGWHDREALIEQYRAKKPKLVLMDWDNTFMDNSKLDQAATPDRVELLAALRAAGVRVGFVTNRPILGSGYGMESVLLARMRDADKAGLLLSTGGGAEVFELKGDGIIPDKPTRGVAVISDEDRATMRAAMKDSLSDNGVDVTGDPSEFSGAYWEQADRSYEYALILNENRAAIDAVFHDFSEKLQTAGILDKYDVKLKKPVDAKNAPYIRVRARGARKASGVKAILRLLRDQGEAIEESDVLYFGDEFAPGEDDTSAASAIPGGRALGVGEHGDARLKNYNQMPAVGADVTNEFLWDIIGQGPTSALRAFGSGLGSTRGPKAWLSNRYKPILEVGIFTGFALGLAIFALFHAATGGLAIIGLPGGVIAGTLIADRLARGSIEGVLKEFEELILRLPGVRRVEIVTAEDGRKAIGVYYGTRKDSHAYSGTLPEIINGYAVEARVVESPVEAALPGVSLDTESGVRVAFSAPKTAAVELFSVEEAPAEGALNPADVLYFTGTNAAIQRFLDKFIGENSGWWSRFRGKQRVIETMVSAFRQELRLGRKPDFKLTTTEDGVKKALLIGGMKPSEFLWRAMKSETGLTEGEMDRFLAIARRIHGERVANLGAQDWGAPEFQEGVAGRGLLGRVRAALTDRK